MLTPTPRRAVRMFIAPPVTDIGRSKSKLPCLVRLDLSVIDEVDSFVPELFLLAPLPLPLATFSKGIAAPIRDSILDSRSLSLKAGDPTRLGWVISTSPRFRLSCLSASSRSRGVRALSLSLPLPLSDAPTGVSLGEGNPHSGEHRPSRSSSSGTAPS